MEHNYFVSVFIDGKNVKSYYSETLDSLPALKSLNKECEICIFDLRTYEVFTKEQVEKEIHQSIMRRMKPKEKASDIAKRGNLLKKPPKVKPKKYWDRPVLCVETGQVYSTIKECSKRTGIPYMTISNCIKNGNATRGLHFVNAPKKK